MNTALATRIFGNKFLFGGAAVELGFIPIDAVSVTGSSDAVLIILTEGLGIKNAQGGASIFLSVATEGAGRIAYAEGADAQVPIMTEGTGQKRAADGASTVVFVPTEAAIHVVRRGAMGAAVLVVPDVAGEHVIRWYTHPGHALPVIVDKHMRPIALLRQAHEIIIDETLTGEHKLTFKLVHPTPPELVAGGLIELAGRVYRSMIMRNGEDAQGVRIVEVEAWSLWYDLTKMPELPAHEWIGASSSEILTWLLPGSEWGEGVVTAAARRNLRWGGGVNRLECLREIERVFNAEIVWDTVRRTVSVISGGGADTGMFFLRGKNLRKVEIETSIADTVHRLYPRGYKGLTIATVNNGIPYLEVPSSQVPPPSAVLAAEAFTDPQQLKEYAENIFATMNTPQVNYSCGIVDISTLPGFEDETIRLGDIVSVYDEGSDVDIKTRVVRMRYNVEQPWNSEIELSTIRSGIGSVLYQNQHDISQLKQEVARDPAALAERYLDTSDKVQRYLDGDTSTINFLRTHEQNIDFIKAGTDGLNTEQLRDKNGTLVYWTDEAMHETTLTFTEFPVLTYVYDELVKLKLFHDIDQATGVHVPKLVLGSGVGHPLDPDRGKGFIFKDDLGLVLQYLKSNGELLQVQIGEHGISSTLSITALTANHTLALADNGNMIDMSSAFAMTLTVPTNINVPFPVGSQILVRQTGVGQITILPASSVTLNAADEETKTRTQFSIAGLVKVASNVWAVFGDLAQ